VDTQTRPLRRDAAENRQRLLDAANELFAEHGLDVTLNDIAHHAGVGVGTAYRRFSNKEAIIDALLDQRIEAVEALAHEALAEPDPWKALVQYLTKTIRLQIENRGHDQIMNDPTLSDARLNDIRVRIAPLTVKIVERAQEAGALRGDFAPTDVAFIQRALAAVGQSTKGIEPHLFERYLTYILDGIRADRGEATPLPVPPLSSEVTHQAMTYGRRRLRR
jgi:AcrR family transcriptional regulator